MTGAPAPVAPVAAATPYAHRLLDRRDWLWMLAFVAAGLAFRLAWFSGFGLGDDFIFRNEVNTILVGRTLLQEAWSRPTSSRATRCSRTTPS